MKLIDMPLTTGIANDAAEPKNAQKQDQRECDWRQMLLASLRAPSTDDKLEQAALSYSEFRVREDKDDREAIDSWYQMSRSVHAELFHDLHRSDPATADRLAR